jgi:hypothetical protein
MHIPIPYSTNVTQIQAKKDNSSLCEIRGCQAKPAKKISVTVDDGRITLQVCEQCASKFFVQQSNISALYTHLVRGERECTPQKKRRSKNRQKRQGLYLYQPDSVDNEKMQSMKEFHVSTKLRKATMTIKQKRLQGASKVGQPEERQAEPELEPTPEPLGVGVSSA